MARKSGLGPQGRSALLDASRIQSQIVTQRRTWEQKTAGKPNAPSIGKRRSGENLSNPAATSTYGVGEADGLPEVFTPFDSSRIIEAAYDRNNERLYVRFVKPRPGGTPWTYEEVPPNVWASMQRDPSPGRFVNRVLNNYNYHAGRWA